VSGGPVPPRLAFVLLALILLLGAGLRFHGLGRESLWNDELQSQWISDLPMLSQVVRTALAQDGHPPLHDAILHFVQKDLGNSEALLRFPSAVAGVLAILALFFLGRQLYGTAEALLAAAFLAVLWCPLYYSQEARPYSLLLLAVLLASSFWVALLRRLSAGRSAGFGLPAAYVACGLACCYLHHFGAGLVALQAVATALLLGRRLVSREGRPALAAYAALLLGYLPGIVYLLRQRRHSQSWAWIAPPDLGSLVEYLKFLFNYSRTITAVAVVFLAIALVAAWRRPEERRLGPLSPSIFLALWLVVPILAAAAVSYLTFPLLTSRNLIVCLPAAYLLVARGFTVVAAGTRLAALGGTAVLLLLVQLLWSHGYYSRPHKEQFREAVAWVVAEDLPAEASASPGGAVVLGRAYHAEYFDYYFARLGSQRRVDLVAGDDASIAATQALLDRAQPRRVWLLRGHQEVGPNLLAFLGRRYALREHLALLGADVWRFER